MNESADSICCWPPDFDLSKNVIQVQNELKTTVPPDRIWAWLIRAALWPSWYRNSHNVCFLSSPPPDLAKGTRFHWWTFTAPIVSTVCEFLPEEGRIAWDGHNRGIHVYHAWLIRPTKDGGCHILTEERQYGFGARLHARFLPWRMPMYHDLWLERLRDNAASGMPPPRCQCARVSVPELPV